MTLHAILSVHIVMIYLRTEYTGTLQPAHTICAESLTFPGVLHDRDNL